MSATELLTPEAAVSQTHTATPWRKLLRLVSFSVMLAWLCLGMMFASFVQRPLLADPDLGWHLRDAQRMVQERAFLHADSFTFTLHGHAWVDPEWLSELAFYAAYRAGHLRGVEVLLIGLLLSLIVSVFVLGAWRAGNARSSVLNIFLFSIFAGVSFSPRTQLFGWLCCVALVAILELYRTGRDYLWALPPLFLLWINLHGSWPVGMILLTLFLVTGLIGFRRGSLESVRWTPSQRNRLLLILALCCIALFCNPYGWQLVAYPYQIAGQHQLTLSTVQEWQTLDFHTARAKLVFALFAFYLLIRALRNRVWSLYDAASLLFAIAMCFTYTRFLLFAGIVFCPMLAEELTFLGRDKPAVEKPLINLAIIAAIVCLMATHIPSEQELRRQSDTGDLGYPAGAVAYLREHPAQGAVFNDFNWGGYLIWNLPGQPVFIDTRTDVFEETGLYRQYFDLLSLKTPIETYNHGELRYVLLPPRSPLALLLSRLPAWKVEYQDETAVLIHRIG
jgi:hypothetical protein